MAGLYLHIPFCEKKCSYCDFVSYSGRQESLPLYLRAVKNEAERFRGEKIETVFLGGGTPSLISEKDIIQLLDFLRSNFKIDENAEVSIECNPHSVTKEKLVAYKQAGINRISLGAQSLSDDCLKKIGRCHSVSELEFAANSAKDMGFNLNLDLIFALPSQTLLLWENTLKRAISLCPNHVSCYSLTLSPGTKMFSWAQQGSVVLPGEEDERRMYYMAGAMLADVNIYQYEVSNYAQNGKECKHNLKYWHGEEYIGLGCAAHSYFKGERYYNTKDLDEYICGKDIKREASILTEADKKFERIMLELRLNEGICIEKFNRDYSADLLNEYSQQVKKNIALCLAECKNGYFYLTEKGRDFADAVPLDFMT